MQRIAPRRRLAPLAACALFLAALPAARGGSPPSSREVGAQRAEATAPAGAVADEPAFFPSMERGRTLYEDACVACHGESGRGDGRRAPELDPPPRSFHNRERMEAMSPASAYEAVTKGIPDSAMAAFDLLPPEDRWSAAFFALSLRHDARAAERGAEILQKMPRAFPPSLGALARQSDGEIRRSLAAAGVSEGRRAEALAFLRHRPLRHAQRAPLARARRGLGEAMSALVSGDRERARLRLAAAHRRGFEPVSPLLAADVRRDLDARFLELRRASGGSEPPEALARRGRTLAAALDARAEVPSAASVVRAAGERAGAALVPLVTAVALGAALFRARRSGRRLTLRTATASLGLGTLAAGALIRELSLAPAFALAAVEAGSGHWALAGAAVALATFAAGAALAPFVYRRWQALGPLVLAALAAILAGHAARGLQLALGFEASWMSLPQLVLFGIYPTREGLLAQGGILLLALALGFRRAKAP